MSNERHCSHCGVVLKIRLHAIRDCTFSKLVWTSVVLTNTQRIFFSLPLGDWLLCNLKCSRRWGEENFEWCSFLQFYVGDYGRTATLMFLLIVTIVYKSLLIQVLHGQGVTQKTESTWPYTNPFA